MSWGGDKWIRSGDAAWARGGRYSRRGGGKEFIENDRGQDGGRRRYDVKQRFGSHEVPACKNVDVANWISV